MTASKMD